MHQLQPVQPVNWNPGWRFIWTGLIQLQELPEPTE